MTFKAYREGAVRVVRAAGEPPKGHHWTAVGHPSGDGWEAKAVRTIVKKGGLVAHRNDFPGYDNGRIAILDRESGLAWFYVGHPGLAKSIVRRHGDAWPELMREVCDGKSPEFDWPDVWHREEWRKRIHQLAAVYKRADPGEDDGGIAYEVENPPENETLGEAGTFGLGMTAGFEGSLYVLARHEDGRLRSWVRRVILGSRSWARFDDGERGPDARSPGLGRDTVRVREFSTLRRALKG